MGILEREIIHALVPYLADEEPAIRRSAAEALERVSALEAVAGLVAMVEQAADREARLRAIYALGRLETAEALAGLARAVKSPHEGTRAAVVRALSGSSHPQATDILLSALEDQSPDIKILAAEALAENPSARVAATMRALLRSNDRALSLCAAHVLARAGDLRVKEALVQFLKSDDPAVRQAAVTSLGTLAIVTARAGQSGLA